MYDELKEEEIVRKVGGRFKLSTLVQKRMVQLNQGARPLIDTNEEDVMAVVLQEILLDKIFLDSADEVAPMRHPTSARLPNSTLMTCKSIKSSLVCIQATNPGVL